MDEVPKSFLVEYKFIDNLLLTVLLSRDKT